MIGVYTILDLYFYFDLYVCFVSLVLQGLAKLSYKDTLEM